MKKYKVLSVFIVFLFSSVAAFAQSKYFTREGFISFHSDTDVEQIHAENFKVTSVLDTESGKMEFAVLMKAFEFEKALMEEHFNENYVESDKFPKATFKGQINNGAAINWNATGEHEVEVSGELTIHGVTKEIVQKGTISIKGEQIVAVSKFMIKLSDFDISIPKVVVKNIAEEVMVEVKINYQKFSKS